MPEVFVKEFPFVVPEKSEKVDWLFHFSSSNNAGSWKYRQRESALSVMSVLALKRLSWSFLLTNIFEYQPRPVTERISIKLPSSIRSRAGKRFPRILLLSSQNTARCPNLKSWSWHSRSKSVDVSPSKNRCAFGPSCVMCPTCVAFTPPVFLSNLTQVWYSIVRFSCCPVLCVFHLRRCVLQTFLDFDFSEGHFLIL